MLGLGSSGASAQSLAANLNVPAAVRALDVDQGSRALGAVATQASLTSAVLSTQPRPAQTVRATLPQSIAPAIAPDHEPLLAIGSSDALLGAPRMNLIEFHTWIATPPPSKRP